MSEPGSNHHLLPFEHLPAHCYTLPKLTSPLVVSATPSRSHHNNNNNNQQNNSSNNNHPTTVVVGKRKNIESEEDLDDGDNPHGCNESAAFCGHINRHDHIICSTQHLLVPHQLHSSELKEEFSEQRQCDDDNNFKKVKAYHHICNEYSTTVASSNLCIPSPFPTLYKHCQTTDWFYNFSMFDCVRNFENYVDDPSDANNIKMSTNDYFNYCYDFNALPTHSSSGLLRLLKDLGITSFYDYKYFIFVFLFNFQSKLSISRSEWIFGMFNLRCDSIDKLRYKINQVTEESYLWNSEQMKNLFTVSFKFLRDSEKSRSIDAHVAAYALRVLMTGRSPFTETFSDFLVSADNPIKSINLDQWKIFVDFSANIAPNLSNYDSNDAWPSLYDIYISTSFGIN
ncbi:hypothetical protein FDP41_013301 [Naegleria fowleri]|uniref:Defective in cullin neddylation protein n=1 Tax=Naegleria fowleri TaxID=5763 RepID=A0A6A5C4M1_NAEFO|nr:uncharacterized protein FDP41_013301 [Naegleria fowleri]KAF0980818.1 hypothetical protein FDP41_013301 [Naegleria fowleri]CAG4718355.1 unnamed protein product [Naegleria fowleri]